MTEGLEFCTLELSLILKIQWSPKHQEELSQALPMLSMVPK